MSKREEMKEMSEKSMGKQFLLSLAEDAEKLLAKSLEECKVNESATMKNMDSVSVVSGIIASV